MASSASGLGTTQDAPRPVIWTYDLTEEDEAEMQTAIQHFSGRTLVGHLPRRPNVQQPLHAENGAENQPIGAENQRQEVAIDAPQVGEQVDGHRQPVVVMQPAEQPAVFDDLQAENPPVMDHWFREKKILALVPKQESSYSEFSQTWQYSDWFGKHVERFKMALDCFFAVWFVVGNIWIFGGHSSPDEAPILYRLCIVFLTFSCISYAMPLVICATVCCCLPCIVTLLSYREEHGHAKGALPDVIAALPVYKFRRKGSNKVCKDETDYDSESSEEGGIFAPGTERERIVSGEDAVCCICLGKYKDGVDLKELQCDHFFHVECVEKWLKINATCPLCKHEVNASNADDQSG
ncbi:hypothetical protein L7F22_063034 [Adiantum nelumboides]|nr:hypothetical protein [Adiantum nelumboides]